MALADDEYTCLMIIDESKSPLLDIGRWKPTLHAMQARGLVKQVRERNFEMTPAGAEALAAHKRDLDGDLHKLLEANNAVANLRTTMQQEAEKAIAALVNAARATAGATGDDVLVALSKIDALVYAEAKKRLAP